MISRDVFHVLLATALTAQPAAAAPATVAIRTPIVVRAYNSGAASSERWGAALAEARRIFASAGFDLAWLTCESGGRPSSDGCDEAAGVNEFAVRVVRLTTPEDAVGQLPLGYSLIDPRTRSGTLATIYVDRVLWLAQNSQADAALLMGRAIAHEIAHLVQGAHAHQRHGLMRPVWERTELQRDRAQDWQFTRADRDAMHAALSARAQTQPPARAPVHTFALAGDEPSPGWCE